MGCSVANFGNLKKQALELFGVDQSTIITDVGGNLLIEELEGKKRTIELTGRSMPYQDVDFGIEQRMTTTWYQGNPVALQQIHGPSVMSTEMEGEWKYLYIQGSINVSRSEIISPTDAVDLFLEIASSGVTVRVSYLNIVRVGVLKKFVPTYVRLQDIKWRMEWEWSSAGETTFRSALYPPPNIGDGASLFGALQKTLANIPAFLNLVNSAIATVITAIDEIGDLVSEILTAIEIASSVASAPRQIYGSVKSNVSALSNKTQELVRQTLAPNGTFDRKTAEATASASSSPTSTKSSSRSGSVENSGDVPYSSQATNSVEYEKWRRDVAYNAYRLSMWAFAMLVDLQAKISPNSIKRVTSGEGDTVYSISTRYYGSPDYANYVAAVNSLESTVIKPGTELLIPPKPSGGDVGFGRDSGGRGA